MVDARRSAFRTVVLGFIWVLVCLAVAFVLAIVAPHKGHAQGGGFVWSERSSSAPHGRYVVMYNATGSTITDGTVVMIDTTGTTTTPQIAIGKGFRTWDGATGNYRRIAGVLLGDVPGFQQGRVLVEGFHNNVLMAATGYTAYTILEPSLTVSGALASHSVNDSALVFRRPFGIFQRYKDVSTLRGYCWIKVPGIAAR